MLGRDPSDELNINDKMTPIDKAERALNLKIEQIQMRIQAAGSERPRSDLVQALLIWASLGAAITEFVGTIGQSAKRRHAELKEKQVALIAQHEGLLKSGQEQLERFKANPADPTVRNEIKQTQRSLEAIQKTLRRGAASLQNEVNPSIRILDTAADHVRRLCESEDKTEIKRWTRAIVKQPEALYRTHPALPTSGIINTATWEESATAAIEQAADFLEAQARGGFQAMLVLEILIMAISQNPPQSSEEAAARANAAVSLRMKDMMERLTGRNGLADK
jgi:hypothetical protein